MYITKLNANDNRYYVKYDYMNEEQKPTIKAIAPSVTTAIGTIKNKELELIINIKGKAFLNRAAERGTIIHNIIDEIIKENKIGINKNLLNYYFSDNNFNDKTENNELTNKLYSILTHPIFLEDNSNVVSEKTLFNDIDRRKIAGTMDYYNKETNVLIDWKSGAIPALNFHYKMQLAVYAHLTKLEYDLAEYPITKIVCPKNHKNRKTLAHSEFILDNAEVPKLIEQFKVIYDVAEWNTQINNDLLKKKYLDTDYVEFDKIAETPKTKVSEIDLLIDSLEVIRWQYNKHKAKKKNLETR